MNDYSFLKFTLSANLCVHMRSWVQPYLLLLKKKLLILLCLLQGMFLYKTENGFENRVSENFVHIAFTIRT